MSKAIKAVRGQLRQIVQELLPTLVTEAFLAQIYKSVEDGLKLIEERHKDSLEKMQQEQRNTLSYLVRQTTISRPSNDQK